MKNAASITVRVPLAIRRRGGRKLVVTPDGGGAPGVAPARTRADPALVKALARAHRRKRLLERGRYGSLAELAAAEKIDRSYLGKTLRLKLLAPDIVEAILDGRQACALALPVLLERLPSLWDEQRSSMAEISDCASSTARPCRSTCDRRAPARAERPCRREPDIGGGDFVRHGGIGYRACGRQRCRRSCRREPGRHRRIRPHPSRSDPSTRPQRVFKRVAVGGRGCSSSRA